MRLQFLGAARTVTGSSHLVEVNDKRILLDCGLFQGRREEARRFNLTLPHDPRSLDAVVLSHGHLDHCGRLPVLFRHGLDAPIYSTEATADVARVVMEDSAEIAAEDAAYINKRLRRDDQPPVEPLYTPADVRAMRKLSRTAPLGRRVDLGNHVGVTLFEAGHILGSAYVWLDWRDGSGRERKLLFTADVGRYRTPILRDPQPPPGPADLVITESTYGGRTHAPVSDIGPELLELLRHVVERRARLLIPSFAVGRTQTKLWYVQRFIAEGKLPPGLRVYVDSPMGVEMTQIYKEHRHAYDDETAGLVADHDLFGLRNVTLASNSTQSRQINADPGPRVIIASSPTCEFGRILHHLTHSLGKPDDVVLMVGWVPPNTLGRRLQDGQKRVRVYDRYYDVRCRVLTLPGMSAHADGDELMRFLRPALTPETQAFVVHGEAEQSEAMAARLVDEGGVDSAAVPAAETSAVVR